MLENLVSPYTATAVERLIGAGAGVVGKTNLDEFGMGSSTDNSALAVTSNPWDPTRVPGGSSGGTAAAVAARMAPDDQPAESDTSDYFNSSLILSTRNSAALSMPFLSDTTLAEKPLSM